MGCLDFTIIFDILAIGLTVVIFMRYILTLCLINKLNNLLLSDSISGSIQKALC